MDIDIKIVNKNFPRSICKKREPFSFSIVKMPYLSNNMPSKTFHASHWAEILWIARPINDLEKFKSLCAKTMSRMMKQGGSKSRIKQCLQFRSFSPTCFDFLKL